MPLLSGLCECSPALPCGPPAVLDTACLPEHILWPLCWGMMLDLAWPNGTTAEVDSGIAGVELTDEFLTALGRLQKGDPYRLKTIKDIFLEPPEPRKWERKN